MHNNVQDMPANIVVITINQLLIGMYI